MTDFAEEYSSPSSALDDMFMFSSQSPAADQLAMFSSDSSAEEEEDLDFGVYDQKPYLAKFSCAHQHRQQRHLATVPVPSMEVQPATTKKHPQVPFMGSLSELCEQKPNLVADVPRCSHQTLSVQPSAVSPSSRIKSTTPNIKLLFSLFDVLDDDSSDDDCCSSSVSSSPSSPASFSDRHSSPEVVTSPSRVPDVDAPKFAVVPNVLYRSGSDSSFQWTTPVVAPAVVVVGDRATMLSSFADLE